MIANPAGSRLTSPSSYRTMKPINILKECVYDCSAHVTDKELQDYTNRYPNGTWGYLYTESGFRANLSQPQHPYQILSAPFYVESLYRDNDSNKLKVKVVYNNIPISERILDILAAGHKYRVDLIRDDNTIYYIGLVYEDFDAVTEYILSRYH